MHLRLLASLILPIHVFHSSACFAASSELAQHVIPFLLDKESSTISETKVCTPPLPIASPLLIDEHPSPQLDALETLSLCAQSYGSLTISRYVEDIWPALRTEVLSTILQLPSCVVWCGVGVYIRSETQQVVSPFLPRCSRQRKHALWTRR